jgi:hypothetical protein
MLSMQKIMILPVCLGIFLAGIVTIPNAFAGCGPGTVLIDGVCELAPIQESNAGCGPGTVMIDGVCELDQTSKSTSMSIEPLYVIIVVVAIGGVVGAIFAVKRGSKIAKPAKQELEEYESKYMVKKPAETKGISDSCNNCGTSLKPTARFCGKCGTPRS